MKNALSILLFLSLSLNAYCTTYYVDETATGLNDGSSWANAYIDFQSVLSNPSLIAGDVVLIAKGTYKPSVGSYSRTSTFALKEGVKFYGGFPSGGGTFASRDFSANRSVFSGDLGTIGDTIDNCFTVVDANNLTTATLMSGITVEKGNADSTTTVMYGRAGGIYLGATGSMSLDSVTIRNNFGKVGSGVYAGMPTNWSVRGCTFDGNNNSSAIAFNGGTPSGAFVNCIFNNNRGGNGGALNINVSSLITLTFTGCTFTNNRATSSGGVVNGGPGTTFTDCIFTSNTAASQAGVLYSFYGVHTFTRCTFTSNSSNGDGGTIRIPGFTGGIVLDACIVKSNFNSSGHGGFLNISNRNSTITNCVFWNNYCSNGVGGAIYNNGGTMDLTNCTFAKNYNAGYGEGGGMSNNSGTSNIKNCIFYGNLSSGNDAASSTEIAVHGVAVNTSYTIWQGNSSGGTIYNTNPLFTDISTGDLTLTECSPAIDTATATGAPVVDVQANARPFEAKPGGLTYDLGAYEYQVLIFRPEISMTGNGNNLADGDATPSTTDDTDFGSQDRCTGTVVKTFTIQNSGNAILNLGSISIGGTNAADFSISTAPSATVAIGGSTTFDITFDPSANGTRAATISFTTDDCDGNPFNFSIQGTGTDGTPSITGTTPDSRCDAGTLNLAATASAGTLNWYDASSGGTNVGTGTSITTPSISSTANFYVDATVGSCTSARTAVSATVNTTPTVNSTTPNGICGTGTVDLAATASAGTLNWYDASSGGTFLGTGTSFTTPSISSSTSYYVDATNTGCTSARTAVLASTAMCTQLRPGYCGSTLSTYNQYLCCDAVTGATAYRFEITDGTNTYNYTSGTVGVRLNLVPGIKYGTTYDITAAAQIGGTWMAYASPCTITTPLTQVETWYCGLTVSEMTQYLACFPVEGATEYKFEISEGPNVYTYTSTSVAFRFSNFPSAKYNTTYSVRVAAKVGGTFSAYGAPCNITTPLTKIQNWYCGITVSPMNQYLACYAVNGATQYKFKLFDGTNTLYFTSNSIGLRLNLVPGILTNTTYAVSVSAYVGGSWSAYGATCNITSAPTMSIMHQDDEIVTAADEQLMEDISIEAYPNPNAGNFTVSSTHEGEFVLTNELGQILQTISLTTANNRQVNIEELGNGMYFITGTINDQVITKKVMVL